MPDSFKTRLIQAMNANDIKAVELSKRTGLSTARISQYVNGKYKPKSDGIYKLAKALNVSELWLRGFNVPIERTIDSIVDEHNNFISYMKALGFSCEEKEKEILIAKNSLPTEFQEEIQEDLTTATEVYYKISNPKFNFDVVLNESEFEQLKKNVAIKTKQAILYTKNTKTKSYDKNADELLEFYYALNDSGKTKAIESIEDLTMIPKYQKEKTYQIKKAARNGSFEETTITDSQLEAIKNLPDIDDLK